MAVKLILYRVPTIIGQIFKVDLLHHFSKLSVSLIFVSFYIVASDERIQNRYNSTFN